MNKLRKIISIYIICFICMLFEMNASAQETSPVNIEIVDTGNHIYTYEEMQTDLAELVDKYSDYISCSPAGVSLDSRTIWQIVIGNPNAPKAIFIEAAVHGREWMNSWMLMKQVESLLQNWEAPLSNGVKTGDIFENCSVYIIPMVNPDGVTISQCGIEAIRSELLRAHLYQLKGASNPERWKANARGVDINRNFPTGWGNNILETFYASKNFDGPAPLSEPETMAVVNAMSQRNFDVAISYHSMEGALYWNLGQNDELLYRSAKLAIEVNQLTGYTIGKQSTVKGLDYNWMILERNTPTVLIETGTVACPLPYSQWQDLWNRNKDIILYLAIIYSV